MTTVECRTGTPRADLLFVHGAWSSSWYWDNFFLPWFADCGYRCRALSLRGHGTSEGRVRWSSVSQYVSDVAVAAQGLENPVLIGHSMGGFIAQLYANQHPVRALALLVSIPPSGAWHALYRVATERPKALLRTLATLNLYGVVAETDTARGLLFSRDESRTDKDHLLQHLEAESFRAFLDMLFNPVRKRAPAGTPVTVIGAEFDQIVSHRNVAETARVHGVDPVMLPLASHMLTVDDRWQDAASLIEHWLQTQVLENQKSSARKPVAAVAQSAQSQPPSPTANNKRAKMLGQMQYLPLTLSSILEHVEVLSPDVPIWSREAPPKAGEVGAIHRQTWRDTGQRVRKLSQALLDFGIGEGDRVASIAWNTHRHLELYYAATGIGAVLHTINPRLSLDHLQFMINQADDRIVFFDGTFSGLIATLKPMCPSVEQWVQMSNAPQAPMWTEPNYEDLLDKATPIEAWPALDEQAAAVLCYTSGTTGNPKGVLYSHRALVRESIVAVGPDVFSISRDDTVAPIVPMFHVNAWSLPFAAAIAGASLALPGANLSGDALFEFFEETETTLSVGVPTVWQALLAHMQKTKSQFSTMRRTVIGGSAVSESMIRAFRADQGVEVLHGWGMTETSPLGTVSALSAWETANFEAEEAVKRLKRQGRAPYGVSLKVTDSEGARIPQKEETAGHLKIRGHWVIDRYFGADEPATEDGWFDTGDIASIGRNAVMTITDRDKDLIKSGGEWISSVHLEDIAKRHPDVVDAAAVAIPHPKWDERPLLVCVFAGGKNASEEEIRSLFSEMVPSWQVPDVAFVDQLPIGATGKVLKADLRATYARFHG
ncbi:MAG: long-chain-fatty-acid--CoA ligase [Pseudomonadota bacterium]